MSLSLRHAMSIHGLRSLARAWTLAWAVSSVQSTEAQSFVGREQISAWFAAHHPSIAAGDRRINAVLLVVDTSRAYVASVADSLPLQVTAAIDSQFAALAARNEVEGLAKELVAGRLRVPGSDSTLPVYIVDGVRTQRIDSLDVRSIEDIQLIKVADAASKYGSDAAKGGAIVVRITHGEEWARVIDASNRQRLIGIGTAPERIDFGDMQIMHVRAGIYGPYPLYITVMRLKARTA